MVFTLEQGIGGPPGDPGPKGFQGNKVIFPNLEMAEGLFLVYYAGQESVNSLKSASGHTQQPAGACTVSSSRIHREAVVSSYH